MEAHIINQCAVHIKDEGLEIMFHCSLDEFYRSEKGRSNTDGKDHEYRLYVLQ